VTKNTGKRKAEKGSTLIEFALVAFTAILVLLGVVEMERMLLVYNAVANSTRAGVRYAMVHGSDLGGSGINAASSTDSHANVVNTVKAVAGTGALNSDNLTVTVTYTACSSGCTHSNDPGSTVSVQAVYPYDPFVGLPLSVNLSNKSEGVITW
jgi:Flp pilus assembly protein TadG